MRSRYLFITVLSAIIFVAILGLRAASSLPQSSVIPSDSPPDKAAAAEPVVVQIDASSPISTKVEPPETQGTRQEDGAVLLEGRCTQCHMAEWLEQVERPRADWEKSLAKMETFGVYLDETEKAILLDYLAAADQP